jgi:uncharacterized protein
MKYRLLPGAGLEISALSFGCMRFPTLSDERVDEDQSIALINRAIELGVNYFDTAYPYHQGVSEKILGKALGRRRPDVLVATKLPTWAVESVDDCERFLEKQLKRLDTSYLDFYLFHGLNHEIWPRMKALGAVEFMEKAVADGRVRRIGFSFHDDSQFFRPIVDDFNWAMCQIQYNYSDRDYQAGTAGLRYAASKGLGVVVMEPLRGGTLVSRIPEEIEVLWRRAVTRRSPAEWALRWLWGHPPITTVLSSMRTQAELLENAALTDDCDGALLSSEDLALIDRVAETYRSMFKVACTSCGYCMPCPQGIHIAENFKLYNDLTLFKAYENSRMAYNYWLPAEQRASNCTQCGQCEELCPQHLRVGELLKEVHTALAE